MRIAGTRHSHDSGKTRADDAKEQSSHSQGVPHSLPAVRPQVQDSVNESTNGSACSQQPSLAKVVSLEMASSKYPIAPDCKFVESSIIAQILKLEVYVYMSYDLFIYLL